MKIQEIREIIKLVDGSSIEEFSYEFEGVKVKMKKSGSGKVQPSASSSIQTSPASKAVEAPSAPAPAKEPKAEELVSEEAPEIPADNESEYHKILSPMVGTFYESPSPDEDAYVQVGTKVTADQVVCIVEAMKLFNEIEAEVDGEIAEILVKDGQLVEYGQPLFLVKAN
ncbi:MULTISPECIES: acetyl-CoA carboxylase biotin carboxyl carrier protein [Planococcus]|uniref:Biotin carboxyl carrier protein of acetyl-CoA carboxylase n=1 Tax=Planococcus wigleyi TaxID=2762216 RepID=A0ABR8WF64_9BACL|nr:MULTISPECIES: acetyl-CoA carboxylase biotin carboxyl carrier protein [Planococcus]MBD8015677.1 acetyl-CoA carboxylase biotin carboxyl carrier protein [Planococcus wigleyi]MBF6632915.1 acetyl-CoA carboxylase biotin carboxyl carrier protein [Planococcus sp. (in: firmicutes)]MDN3438051.1 acetyl-CoA carboxylase biotin carboxyl carrier protein [Planococcus sp. APC 3900]